MTTKTLKFRIKDKHASWMLKMSRAVNFIWNEGQAHALEVLRREGKFVSGYDLHHWSAGATKEGLEIPSHTMQQVLEEYATRRKQFKKMKLKWRKSFGAKRNTGWVPFKNGQIKYRNGQLKFAGHHLSMWDSYGIAQYKDVMRSGSFSEDARGRWYLNIVVSFEPKPSEATSAIGVDLGLKTIATPSHGESLDAGRWTQQAAPKLAVAQREKHKKQVKNIHAKIKNRRKDAIHKYTSNLVKNNAAIFVGNVSSTKLAKTWMAKIVLDSGWGMVKQFCEYKSRWAGTVFAEVNEKYTTVACSNCGQHTGPKGLKQTSVRDWSCMRCGTAHHRDKNASKNILAIGLNSLSGGAQHV
jgi:putative transposase